MTARPGRRALAAMLLMGVCSTAATSPLLSVPRWTYDDGRRAGLRLRGGAGATAYKSVLAPGEVTGIANKAAFDLALLEAGDKLVVVDFTAEWCGPCQRIAPKVESMAIELRKSAFFLKVDVDDNEETAGACGVTCMPTFQLFRNGDKVGEIEGADEARLRALIDQNKGASEGDEDA